MLAVRTCRDFQFLVEDPRRRCLHSGTRLTQLDCQGTLMPLQLAGHHRRSNNFGSLTAVPDGRTFSLEARAESWPRPVDDGFSSTIGRAASPLTQYRTLAPQVDAARFAPRRDPFLSTRVASRCARSNRADKRERPAQFASAHAALSDFSFLPPSTPIFEFSPPGNSSGFRSIDSF